MAILFLIHEGFQLVQQHRFLCVVFGHKGAGLRRDEAGSVGVEDREEVDDGCRLTVGQLLLPVLWALELQHECLARLVYLVYLDARLKGEDKPSKQHEKLPCQ